MKTFEHFKHSENRIRLLYLLWTLFLITFTTSHIYSKYNYMLRRISASYARTSNGQDFNNGCGKRPELMDLALEHIGKAKGVFARYPHIKKQDIAKIASVGFLSYHLYPVPVYYRDDSSINKCDYLLSRKTFPGRIRSFMIINDEENNFELIAENGKFILMKRKRR